MPRLVRISATIDRCDALYLATDLAERISHLCALADQHDAQAFAAFGTVANLTAARAYRRNADRLAKLRQQIVDGTSDV